MYEFVDGAVPGCEHYSPAGRHGRELRWVEDPVAAQLVAGGADAVVVTDGGGVHVVVADEFGEFAQELRF